MKRRRLHWFWRAAIATVVACLFSGLTLDVVVANHGVLRNWVNDWIPFIDNEDVVLVPVLISLPAILVAFVAYVLLTRFTGGRVEEDRETRCRNCGYILRGLREPTCSECGEQI
jgi:hypothetical protein